MKRFVLPVLLLLPVLLASSQPVRAHCEVPCGIFDDPARFKGMLEDASTIAKAMKQIQGLAGKTDAQSWNQAVRWIKAKEEHATRTMETIGQYFMAQRIKLPKAGDAGAQNRYIVLLTSAHKVTVLAMKCKQTVDPTSAEALKTAIELFQRLYDNPSEEKAGGGSAHGGHKHR